MSENGWPRPGHETLPWTLRMAEFLTPRQRALIPSTYEAVGLRSPDFDVVIGDGQPGIHTRALRAHLTGIQFGTEPDRFGWLRPVN